MFEISFGAINGGPLAGFPGWHTEKSPEQHFCGLHDSAFPIVFCQSFAIVFVCPMILFLSPKMHNQIVIKVKMSVFKNKIVFYDQNPTAPVP
jgi:hypothetical protein